MNVRLGSAVSGCRSSIVVLERHGVPDDPIPARCECPSVLHVTTARTWRGGEQQVFYLMQGLARGGARQRLLAPPASALARRAAAAGLPVTPWRVRNEADAFALGRLLEEVRRRKPDALHLHTSQAHGLGAVAARLAGRRRPRIVVTRRVEYSIFRHGFLGLDRWKYDPGADVVLCVSSRVRDVLRGDGIAETRLRVVPDGIDTARFVPQPERGLEVRAVWGIPEDAWVVGNVSHCDPAKGQRHLIEAFARLAAADADAHLLVVGGGKELPALRARAAELGLGPRVTFTGFQRNVPSLLDAMDVFAFPSLAEGLGSAVLEAAAPGTPIVATAVGGHPRVDPPRAGRPAGASRRPVGPAGGPSAHARQPPEGGCPRRGGPPTRRPGLRRDPDGRAHGRSLRLEQRRDLRFQRRHVIGLVQEVAREGGARSGPR